MQLIVMHRRHRHSHSSSIIGTESVCIPLSCIHEDAMTTGDSHSVPCYYRIHDSIHKRRSDCTAVIVRGT